MQFKSYIIDYCVLEIYGDTLLFSKIVVFIFTQTFIFIIIIFADDYVDIELPHLSQSSLNFR